MGHLKLLAILTRHNRFAHEGRVQIGLALIQVNIIRENDRDIGVVGNLDQLHASGGVSFLVGCLPGAFHGAVSTIIYIHIICKSHGGDGKIVGCIGFSRDFQIGIAPATVDIGGSRAEDFRGNLVENDDITDTGIFQIVLIHYFERHL